MENKLCFAISARPIALVVAAMSFGTRIAAAQPSITFVDAGPHTALYRPMLSWDGQGLMGNSDFFSPGGDFLGFCPYFVRLDTLPGNGATVSATCADRPSSWSDTYVGQHAQIGAALVAYGSSTSSGLALLSLDWQGGGPSAVQYLDPIASGFYPSFETSGLSTGPIPRVVVTLINAWTGVPSPVTWQLGQGYVGLGPLPPGWTRAYTRAISRNGTIISGTVTVNDSVRPFRWDDGGRYNDCGNLPPFWLDAHMYSASGDGNVLVGGAPVSGSGTHAFYWEPGARYHDDGMFGGQSTVHLATNGDGSVRGGYAISVNDGTLATIATPAYGLRSLRQLLESWRVTGLDGKKITMIGSISDDGLTVAGNAVDLNDPDSRGEAFVVRVNNWCLPGFLSGPQNVNSAGSAATFTVVIDGPQSPQIRWEMEDSQASSGWTELLDGPMTIDGVSGIVTGAWSSGLTLSALQPGSFTRGVRAVVFNSCGSVTSETAMLTHCAADFNGDGSIDFFDYLDFVAAFSSGDLVADFNQDAEIDFFDYLDFVAAFSIGCA